MLAQDFDCRLVLETFNDNPFLPLFYEDTARFALPVELFFMAERLDQMTSAFSASKKDDKPIIADYFFEKTNLFAKNNLKGEEYVLFQRLYQLHADLMPHPDLLIYLHRSPVELLQNIKKRGRTYETQISSDYLAHIEKMYFDYIRSEKKIPILVLYITDKYYERTDDLYQFIKSLLSKKYAAGVQEFIF